MDSNMCAANFNGFCKSVCSHPCCWNYYRNILKNQVSTLDTFKRKPLSVVIPHQSILNINMDTLPYIKSSAKPDTTSPQNKNNNDLLEYLLSRKRMTTPHVPHVTPHIANSTFLKESTNTNSGIAKLSQLDVHEIFDIEELQSDWKKTFKSKDIYVWIPGQQNERDFKIKKDSTKLSRVIKTPVMQLAPVIEGQLNSSRKHTSSLSGGSEINSQNTMLSPKKSMKKIIKKKIENTPIITNRPDSYKENIRQKSLEAALSPQKMQIHNIVDRNVKFEPLGNNQIYVLDPSRLNYSLEKLVFNHNKTSPRSIQSSEFNTNGLAHVNISRIPNANCRTVSIIDRSFANDSFDLRLGPQRATTSFVTTSSRTGSSINPRSNDFGSVYDSMGTNALSDRSTLHDEDLFPGSSMLQILQNSYKLVKERSESVVDEISEKQPLDTIYDQLNEPPIINAPYYRRPTKSAPENIALTSGIPNPPPPSPEISNRFRSTSAAPDLNRIEIANQSQKTEPENTPIA